MRSLERLLRPRSIAVFGGVPAAAVIDQCERLGFAGEIWPVQPSKSEVGGRRAYRSVTDLPGAPDAAFVAVNRHLTIEVVRELAAAILVLDNQLADTNRRMACMMVAETDPPPPASKPTPKAKREQEVARVPVPILVGDDKTKSE